MTSSIGRLRDASGSLAAAVRGAAFRTIGLLFRRSAARVPRAPARVLVIQLQQLGDTVIFTPTMRALRELYPDARIDVLATPAAAQVYRKSPWVNELHVTTKWPPGFTDTRVRRLLPLLRQLRAKRYDITIADLTEQSLKYTLITWLVGSPWRVGFDVGGRGFLHSVRVPYRPEANWVDANLDIVRTLGGEPRSSREEVAFDASDAAVVEQAMRERGYDGTSRIVVMHTGANWQSRTWYHDRWAALADTLATRHGVTIVFVGGAGEAAYVEQIRAGMTTRSISLAGVTDIPQLAALCSGAALFVGTDSGPRQIARASGCPHVVVMCAQDDTDQWAGWGRGEVILRSFPPCHGCYYPHCAHKTCMDAIEGDRVLAWCEHRLTDPRARESEPRQDRVEIPIRLQPMAARGKLELRALAHGPANPS